MSHVDEGTLHAMLDGELTGEESKAVKAHLDSCAACRALLDQARDFLGEADSLVEMLDEEPASAAPTTIADSGGVAVRRSGGRPWYRTPQFLAAAATITVAIGTGYLVARQDLAPVPSEVAPLSREVAPRADQPAGDERERQEEEAVGLALQQAPQDQVEGQGAAPDAEANAARDALRDVPEPSAPAKVGLADAAPAAAPPEGAAGQDRPLEETLGRLAGELKLIEGRRPVRVEQEPAPALEGAAATGGLVRVVYQDEQDREFILEQVKLSFDDDVAKRRQNAPAAERAAASVAERESFLRVSPNDTVITPESDSTIRIRWVDRDGFLLALIGVDEAFLREMMARIE